MVAQEPYVVCRGCGNHWAEHDQAGDWTSIVSKCCGLPLYRSWERPPRNYESSTLLRILAILSFVAMLVNVVFRLTS